MTDQTALTIPQQREIAVAINTSALDLDMTLNKMSPTDQAIYLRDNIRGLQSLSIRISQDMLLYLWAIMGRSLWTYPLEDGVIYDSFRDWVDDQIEPTFKIQNYDKPPERIWLQDAVRIVERVFPYVVAHPVKTEKGELVTPFYLIYKVGLGKLKMTSSKFAVESGLDTEQRNELLKDITHMKSSELRLKYTTTRIPALKASTNTLPSGNTDVIFMGLTDKQYKYLTSALGEMNLKESQVHLLSEDRNALLSILPPGAENDYSRKSQLASTTDSDDNAA